MFSFFESPDGAKAADEMAKTVKAPNGSDDDKTAPLDETAPLDDTFDSLSPDPAASESIEIIESAMRATTRLDTTASGARLTTFADDVKDLTEEEEDPRTAISTREIDYDDKPTDLYSLVEKRQWDHALNLLSNLAPYAALTQASTWVVRKEAATGKLRWRLLPLHASIIFKAPINVIEGLVKAYPGAARCKDDQGMLPIHLAFRNDAPDEIVDEVLGAYPAAVNVHDRKGRAPLTCAMGSNCTKKARAKLLASYSSIAMAAEREKILTEEHAKNDAEVAELKSAYESSLVEKLAVINRYEQDAVQSAALQKQLEESAAREAVLTEKVHDLTKALEALTLMRQAENKRFNEETSQWSAVSRDLLDKVSTLEKEKSVVGSELETTLEEKEQESVEKDVLRSSIDDLVQSHRRLQAERDDLADRNDVLESLLEKNLSERDGIHDILAKLDQDMTAAQTVRERMVSAIAKQENEVYGLAAREHDVMRGILERQRAEMYAALRGEKIGEAELEAIQRQAISPSYSNLGIRESRSRDQGIRETRSRGRSGSPIDARNRSTSDMSALGLGGAEDNRTPPRPPGSPKRSGSPYNRAQNPTAR
mmetsp:Transcript_29494/g.65401  ORF Transcript_29494/g.65401 Transcript_29494/m.65401 type:complete len:595 (-) Transcript_29494:255-2039(-)